LDIETLVKIEEALQSFKASVSTEVAEAVKTKETFWKDVLHDIIRFMKPRLNLRFGRFGLMPGNREDEKVESVPLEDTLPIKVLGRTIKVRVNLFGKGSPFSPKKS